MKNIERLAIESVIYDNVSIEKGRDDMLVALRQDADQITTLRAQFNELVEALESVSKIEFAGSCCGCSTDKGFDEIQKVVTATLAKQKGG